MPDLLESPLNSAIFSPFGIDSQTGLPYSAHPTQQKIHDWCEDVFSGKFKGIPVLYVQHGVNSGGTRGCLNPILEILTTQPGTRVLIGRRDFNDLKKSTMETFFDIVPASRIAKRNDQDHEYKILCHPPIDATEDEKRAITGKTSTVFFRELKDVDGLGSQEFRIIFVTEAYEISLRAYQGLKRRCRQGKRVSMILMEGNPPTENHWLMQLTDPLSAHFDPDITKIIMPSTENWENMTPAYQESLQNMAPSLKRRFIMGEAGFLQDGTPVYPSFVESVHSKDVEFLRDRPIIRGWDFGVRKAACVWCQRHDNGQFRILREWMAIETPEHQFIAGVKLRTSEWFGGTVCRDYGDPAARNRDPEGKTTLMRLAEQGIMMGYRQTTYAERIPLINQKLSQMIQGEPLVVIDPACRILIEGFMGGYHYPEVKPGEVMNYRKEIPQKEGWFEHPMNALEYVFVNVFMPDQSHLAEVIKERNARRRRLELDKRTGVVSF